MKVRHWLIKTPLGWCGVSVDGNVLRRVVLPSPDKTLVLKRLLAVSDPSGILPSDTEALRTKRRVNSRALSARLSRKELGISVMEVTGNRKHRWSKLIGDYFNGKCRQFNAVKIDISRFTPFEQRVYRVVRAIPYGRVRTYSEVAKSAGCPQGARAVGNAMAKNPLPIIIPCHRVVSRQIRFAHCNLGGMPGKFSAIGGTELKRRLLVMEGAI